MANTRSLGIPLPKGKLRFYTMPLYCAIAYSVGGLLNRTIAATTVNAQRA
jgi:hypothetical protein